MSIQQERLARRGLDSAEGFKDVFIALVRTFLTELVLTITVPSRLLTLGKAFLFLSVAYILACVTPAIVTTIVRLVPEITKDDVLTILKETKEFKDIIKLPEKETR